MEMITDQSNLVKLISGFTGSLATLIITETKNYILTDSRYFLQVKLELGKNFELIKFTRNLATDLKSLFSESTALFYAPTFSVAFKNKFDNCFKELFPIYNLLPDTDISIATFQKEETLKFKQRLLSKLNVPKINQHIQEGLINVCNRENKITQENLLESIFILSESVSGQSISSKIDSVLKIMKNHKIENLLISDLNDVSWLLNMIGFDYEFTPVVQAYVLIKLKSEIQVNLYLRKNLTFNPKIDSLFKNITVKKYSLLPSDLSDLGEEQLTFDADTLNMKIFEKLNFKSNKTSEKYHLINALKSIKNPVQLENAKRVHIRDSLVLIKFWYFYTHENGYKLSELDLSKKLEFFRNLESKYLLPSFESIIAKASNAAIVHYNPGNTFKAESKNSDEMAKKIHLTLMDVGGQYIDGGTTDVTRVFIKSGAEKEFSGELLEEYNYLKRNYTLVLKSKLSIFKNCAVSSKLTGKEIDGIVRDVLTKNELTYGHGTGHGIGALGPVHEGPYGLYGDSKLPANVITSVEPGYYLEGKYGIRLEDAVFTKIASFEEAKKNNGEEYLEFEILTLIPYERELIFKDLLDEEEIKILNDYNKLIYDVVGGLLREEDEYEKKVKVFLKNQCKEV